MKFILSFDMFMLTTEVIYRKTRSVLSLVSATGCSIISFEEQDRTKKRRGKGRFSIFLTNQPSNYFLKTTHNYDGPYFFIQKFAIQLLQQHW